jgi:hypothetical protein
MAFTDDVITATSSLSVTWGPGGADFAQFLPDAGRAYINGCLGVGTGSFIPSNAVDVKGALAVGASYAGSVSAPANGAIIEGNVGIGIASPAAKLHVAGGLRVDGPIQGAFAAGAIQSLNIADDAVTSVKLAKSDGAGKGVKTAHLQDGAVTLAKLAADARPSSLAGVSSPDGNIDMMATAAITISADNINKCITIGEGHSQRTDNPHAITAAQVGALALNGGELTGDLQVNGELEVVGHVGIGTPAATGANLVVQDAAAVYVQINGNSGSHGLYFGADANHPWMGSRTNHDLRLVTNSTEKMRITASGNVAIGTATVNPTVRLAVVGGPLSVGDVSFKPDASIHVHAAMGGFGRLLQMSPNGASQPGLNLLASTNAASGDQWWAWGVTPENTWRIQPGIGLGGTLGLSIAGNGNVSVSGNLEVAGIARVSDMFVGNESLKVVITSLKRQVADLQEELRKIKSGELKVGEAVWADKSRMLRARDDDHFLKCSHVTAENHDAFRLYRGDGAWFDLIEVPWASWADKSRMLRARDDSHFMRCSHVTPENRDAFQLYRVDGQWFALIEVAFARNGR